MIACFKEVMRLECIEYMIAGAFFLFLIIVSFMLLFLFLDAIDFFDFVSRRIEDFKHRNDPPMRLPLLSSVYTMENSSLSCDLEDQHQTHQEYPVNKSRHYIRRVNMKEEFLLEQTLMSKQKLDVVCEVIEVLHAHECTVWDAEQILAHAMRVIRATTVVDKAEKIPYQLPPKVNL